MHPQQLSVMLTFKLCLHPKLLQTPLIFNLKFPWHLEQPIQHSPSFNSSVYCLYLSLIRIQKLDIPLSKSSGNLNLAGALSTYLTYTNRIGLPTKCSGSHFMF